MTTILKIIMAFLLGISALIYMGSVLLLVLAEFFQLYLIKHDNKGNRFMAFCIGNENIFWVILLASFSLICFFSLLLGVCWVLI